ncbi:MAG: HAD family phosphatase [Verrucomicrobiae bacterium]|nr:HAD family phosphatase [Verrucomicrobiae bacterium]
MAWGYNRGVLSAMPRLLSTDFDGTIYDPSEPEPVDLGLLDHFDTARADGAQWVINTGRHLEDVLEVLAALNLGVAPDFIVSVERYIHRRNRRGFEEHAVWNRSCRRDHDALFKQAEAGMERLRRRIADAMPATLSRDEWSPLAIIAKTPEDAETIHRWALEESENVENLCIVRNGHYFRFSHANYSKGTALREIAGLLDLGPERVFAAGDHYNDLPMLEGVHARHVAAPSNAIREVKRVVRQAGGHVSRHRCGRGVLDALQRLQNPSNSIRRK